MSESPEERIRLRPATVDDSEFIYVTKRLALGEMISATWGWDEAFQRDYHTKNFDPAETEIVRYDGNEVGCLIRRDEPEYAMLESIYILPDFQNRGIGSALVIRLQAEAAEKGKPARLHVLKINPAVGLYKRLKFRIIAETGNHYIMQWEPDQPTAPTGPRRR